MSISIKLSKKINLIAQIVKACKIVLLIIQKCITKPHFFLVIQNAQLSRLFIKCIIPKKGWRPLTIVEKISIAKVNQKAGGLP